LLGKAYLEQAAEENPDVFNELLAYSDRKLDPVTLAKHSQTLSA